MCKKCYVWFIGKHTNKSPRELLSPWGSIRLNEAQNLVCQSLSAGNIFEYYLICSQGEFCNNLTGSYLQTRISQLIRSKSPPEGSKTCDGEYEHTCTHECKKCNTTWGNEDKMRKWRQNDEIKTSLTTPPASDTIRAPAAISQQWIPSKSWFKYFFWDLLWEFQKNIWKRL